MSDVLAETKKILADALQIGERAESFDQNTPLMGSIPELDSMAVVAVLTAMEEYYGFIVEDDEISGETFSTLGALAEFVEQKL